MQVRALSLLTFTLAATSRLAVSQTGACDPRLLQPPTNPLGYRLRGDRCEGIYIQDVAGAPLEVASFTKSFSDYDPASKQAVKVEWDTPDAGVQTRLRAQSLRRRLYYRMDTLARSGSKTFTWPSDVLNALRLSREEIGIVGIARTSVGETQHDIYLPLRVGQDRKASASGGYQLVLVPGVELKEIFVTLTAQHGKKSSVLKDGEALGYGFYPAERPVAIPISGVRDRGVYHLEIGATLRSGGASTADLWFYHAGG
jgi:hypothetical protein